MNCGHDNSRRWFPADPATQGQIVGWIARLTQEFHPALQARRDALFGDGARKGEIRGARLALRGLDYHMTYQQMVGLDWIAGRMPTLADVIAFPAFALSRDYGLDHEEFPTLRQWYRRLRTSPGFIGMPGIPDYH